MAEIDLPDHVARVIEQIQALERRGKKLLTEEKTRLACARLELAVWSCRKENAPLTRATLAEILGPDAAFVFKFAEDVLLGIRWESAADREISQTIYDARYRKTGKRRAEKEDQYRL